MTDALTITSKSRRLHLNDQKHWRSHKGSEGRVPFMVGNGHEICTKSLKYLGALIEKNTSMCEELYDKGILLD